MEMRREANRRPQLRRLGGGALLTDSALSEDWKAGAASGVKEIQNIRKENPSRMEAIPKPAEGKSKFECLVSFAESSLFNNLR
jgi:hypothetical protein